MLIKKTEKIIKAIPFENVKDVSEIFKTYRTKT